MGGASLEHLEGRVETEGGDIRQLAERLADIGISEKEVNVANKLSRGKFSAAFMLQCLSVIGSSHLHLD